MFGQNGKLSVAQAFVLRRVRGSGCEPDSCSGSHGLVRAPGVGGALRAVLTALWSGERETRYFMTEKVTLILCYPCETVRLTLSCD